VRSRLAEEQLAGIAEFVTLANGLGVPVWLRGGWAMDFFLCRVTRDHVDIDWFALANDGQQLADGLIGYGFEDVTTTQPGQQIDLVRGNVDHGIALVQRKPERGAGGRWPVGRRALAGGDARRTRGPDRSRQRAGHRSAGPD